MSRDRWLLLLSAGLSCAGLAWKADPDGGLQGGLRPGDAFLVAGSVLAFSLAVICSRRHAIARRAIRVRQELLAVVSHDLRNPLGAVALNADLVERLAGAGIAGASVSEKARLIRRSAEHMEVLLRDLLDAAALEAGRFPLVRARQRLEPLLDEALEQAQPLAQARGLRLEWQRRGSLPEVDCDRERVLQLFSNLIGNAIKFTPTGGSIVVHAEVEEGAVRCSVTDTGCGLAEEELAHVFDRYWRSAGTGGRSGAGLGLHIVKGIAEAHGGRVHASSSVGRGSTFGFTLPAARPERV